MSNTAITNALITAVGNEANVGHDEASEIIHAFINDPDPTNNPSVIFDGAIVPRDVAIARLDADTVKSRGVTFYDLMDTIDAVQSKLLRSRLLNSMSWAINARILGFARDIFYRGFEQVEKTDKTVDDFNNYLATIKEIQAGADYAEALGFEQNTDALKQMRLLLCLRTSWLDKAETAAASIKERFTPPDLETMATDNSVMAIDENVLTNCRAFAKMATADTPEHFDATYNMLVAQKQNQLKSAAEQRKLVAPAVLAIIHGAEPTYDAEFHQLSISTQVALITSAQQATKRLTSRLATQRVDPLDYAMLLPEAFALIKQFDTILAADKFAA